MQKLALTTLHKIQLKSIGLVLLVVIGNILATQSYAQSEPKADRRGWMAPDRTALDRKGQAEAGTNRPVKLESEPADPSPTIPVTVSTQLDDAAWTSPNSLIRSQIGLANFDSDDPLPTNEITSPANPKRSENGNKERFELESLLSSSTHSLTAPAGIEGSLKFALLLGALSLAPAIILMTTCYIRVVVVLSLLKQAFGGHQLPPTQILTALSLFITLLIMTPVWSELKQNAIDPYSANEIAWEEAWRRGIEPIKSFMVRQIELAGNSESVAVFYKYADVGASIPPGDLSEVPINVLIPAFMISELKVAFLLGFQIYLPFLVMDLIVSSVTVSMGMFMLPPQMVSFPLKLILFVLVDGWNLVIGMLLQSFGAML